MIFRLEKCWFNPIHAHFYHVRLVAQCSAQTKSALETYILYQFVKFPETDFEV